jgi:hypothetical protein
VAIESIKGPGGYTGSAARRRRTRGAIAPDAAVRPEDVTRDQLEGASAIDGW